MSEQHLQRVQRGQQRLARLIMSAKHKPSRPPKNWAMGKPRWTWDFLRPLGMGLGWVVFQNVPGEIQRHYAREIASWDVRATTTLELWPGVSLSCRPRYYPTAAFIVSGPTGAAGLELSKRAMELGKEEALEQSRIEGRTTTT